MSVTVGMNYGHREQLEGYWGCLGERRWGFAWSDGCGGGDIWMEREKDGIREGGMDRKMDRERDRRIDEWKEGWMGGWRERQTDGWREGRVHREVDGGKEGWTDGGRGGWRPDGIGSTCWHLGLGVMIREKGEAQTTSRLPAWATGGQWY